MSVQQRHASTISISKKASKKLNPVSPSVKSAEKAVLWFSCVGSNANGRSPENGSAVAAEILGFAQSNRQLNVSDGRLPSLSLPVGGREEPCTARETPAASVGGSGNLFLPLRDARPSADLRKGPTYNSSAVQIRRNLPPLPEAALILCADECCSKRHHYRLKTFTSFDRT